MMRWRFLSQRTSITAASTRMVASTMRVTPPGADSEVSPLVISSTSSVPTSALVTEPRPPPRLMPPSTAAVSTSTSMPTPMSAPAVARRAAKKKPAAPPGAPALGGRWGGPANGHDVPADAQPREQHMAANGHHRVDPGHGRQAQQRAVAQKVPGRRVGHGAGDGGGVLQAQDFIDRAKDDQRDQRRQKGAQLQV